MTQTRGLYPTDLLDVDEPCPDCGSKVYIIDTVGGENPTYWLLCFDPFHKGCVNTRELPEGVEINED